VLITTRRSGFRALGSVLDLDTLGRADAVALLRRRAPDLTGDQAGQLAGRLGDLPLALDQAAAYLDQSGMPAGEYLRLLDTRGADLHGRGRAAGHPGNVATVWSVSVDRLQASFPAAVQLLRLCAWLAPEPVPLDLFTGHSGLLPEPLAAAAADPVAFSDAVGALADYSLARRAEGTVAVHRLIQDVTRQRTARPGAADGSKPLETVLALLRADLPGDILSTPGSWPRWRALLPSVLAATGHHEDPAGQDPTIWLLNCAGAYLRSQGRYAEALPLHQRALRIREAALGPDHPHVATDLSHVGRALSYLGRYAEALPLQQRALRIREAALGPDHPDVATDLSYVGAALSDLGRPAEALPLYQRALHIREAALGPDHPHVATDLSNVGQALSDLGRPAEALPLYQRALHIREAALGPDHPATRRSRGYVEKLKSSE
jgi:tetratricopeptide (TPR) repeat protein